MKKDVMKTCTSNITVIGGRMIRSQLFMISLEVDINIPTSSNLPNFITKHRWAWCGYKLHIIEAGNLGPVIYI